ncbi:MAG: hypothetical protein CXR31_14185 [Geobacter sp.]|nr:MAG: hypothetical protein CXR31_14185 [Geobacter sp.]
MRVKVTVPVNLNKYPRLKPKELGYFIADSLRFEQAKIVENDEEKINFTVGIFRSFWDWKSLSMIHGGEIKFQTDASRILIVSRLSFADTVVNVSVLVGLIAYFNHRTLFFIEDNVIFYVVAWLWTIGWNMTISVYSWRRFIRQCIKEATDRVYVSREDLMANIQVQN